MCFDVIAKTSTFHYANIIGFSSSKLLGNLIYLLLVDFGFSFPINVTYWRKWTNNLIILQNMYSSLAIIHYWFIFLYIPSHLCTITKATKSPPSQIFQLIKPKNHGSHRLRKKIYSRRGLLSLEQPCATSSCRHRSPHQSLAAAFVAAVSLQMG